MEDNRDNIKNSLENNLDFYRQYIEHKKNTQTLQTELSQEKFLCDQCLNTITAIEHSSFFPTSLSSHAYTNISKRLEVLCDESQTIKNSVVTYQLFKPTMLEVFVFSMIQTSIENKSYKIVTSKNNSSALECHYTCIVNEIPTEGKELQFACVVEGSTVKTGYFNWVNLNDYKNR